jgi:hypothetical protein
MKVHKNARKKNMEIFTEIEEIKDVFRSFIHLNSRLNIASLTRNMFLLFFISQIKKRQVDACQKRKRSLICSI